MGTNQETVRRTFELPTRLAEKLVLIAEADDVTPSAIVIDALTLHFDQFVEADPQKVAELLAEIGAIDIAVLRR